MTHGLKPGELLVAEAWASHGTSEGVLTPPTKGRNGTSTQLPWLSTANSFEPSSGPGKLETQEPLLSAQFAYPYPEMAFEVQGMEQEAASETSLSKLVPDDFNSHPSRNQQ
jgi:hypothetical protein